MGCMTQRIAADEVVYRGRRVTVHSVQVARGQDEPVQRDLLEVPDAAVIVPVLDDGAIVLIRNSRYAVDEVLLELPAGMVDSGEATIEAAGRELAEETGYTARRLEPLGSFYSAPGMLTEMMHAFVATQLSPGLQRLEPYETIAVELHGPAAVREMVLDGTIRDAKTIAALSLYWLSGRGR